MRRHLAGSDPPREADRADSHEALTMPASRGPAVGSAAMEIDWHADRSALEDLATLDQLEAGEPIDLVAVRAYRLGRVRALMAAALWMRASSSTP